MDSFNDVLVAAKEYCKEHTVEATYELYIEKLQPVSFTDSSHVVLEMNNSFLCGIVNDRYLPLLQEAFKSVLGFDVQVTVQVPWADPANDPVAAIPVKKGDYPFTFENFIQGPSNQFTLAAAQAVANNPAGAYNPLFIWGASGLGKTHLLNAIKNEIIRTRPDYNIIYTTCEEFTNDLIQAIKNGSTEMFRQRYRQADILLVDDIQFIAGKESTQEEFFHTFNTLHETDRQIVIASDRPPKEIKSLMDRLRTRFEWGLTADIQPPEFETRVAIVNRKAELLGLEMPADVAEYLANHLRNNIRQLEGAVKKLNAYYMLEGIEPCVGVAQNAIKDTLNEIQPIPVTIERIISEVSRTYNVTADDIRSNKRNSNISTARQVAMYAVREITGMSLEEIGREFGGRDHSTVVYSMKKMEESLASNSTLKSTVEDIIKNVRS